MRSMKIGALALVVVASASCAPSPTETVTRFVDALNAGDLDRTMEVVSPGIALQALGTIYQGTEETRGWFASLVDAKTQLESTNDRSVSDAQVTWKANLRSRELAELGLAGLAVTCTAGITNGKVTRLSLDYTEEARRTLSEALAAEAKAVAAAFGESLVRGDAMAAELLGEDVRASAPPDVVLEGKDAVGGWLRGMKWLSVEAPTVRERSAHAAVQVDRGMGPESFKLHLVTHNRKVSRVTVTAL